MTYPEIVSSDLDEVIVHALKNSTFAMLTKHTRRRNVSRTDIMKALLFMQGGSLQKEMHKLGMNISASAFAQRRRQISSELPGDILTEPHVRYAPPKKAYQGYRVLAVGGTAVNMARNAESRRFVCNTSAPQLR